MRFQMVLTASIAPKGMIIKVTDGNTRRDQYLRAVRAILDTADPIVEGLTFIENTGADLTPFRELAAQHNPYGKRVEFIGLELNDYPREYGIGYGEFRLLDAGIAASTLLTPQHHLVKLTGRLIVKNLPEILHGLPQQVDLAADVRVWGDGSDGWCESRLMVFSYDFYQRHVVGMYKQVNGSKSTTAEHCLYQLIRHTPGAHFVGQLPREPRWVGVSGSTGKRYDSLSMRLRHPLRVMRRTLRRWLGLPDLRAVQDTADRQSAEAKKFVESPAAVAN